MTLTLEDLTEYALASPAVEEYRKQAPYSSFVVGGCDMGDGTEYRAGEREINKDTVSHVIRYEHTDGRYCIFGLMQNLDLFYMQVQFRVHADHSTVDGQVIFAPDIFKLKGAMDEERWYWCRFQEDGENSSEEESSEEEEEDYELLEQGSG